MKEGKQHGKELPRTSAAGRNRLVLSRILLSMLLSFLHRRAPLVQQDPSG